MSRWMGFIGIVIVAAVIVSFGPLTSGSPDENASGVSVAHWYNTHVTQSWLSIYLVGLALALLLLYVTHLRTVLREASGQSLWPNLAFASGILLIGGFITAGATQVTIILAAHNHEYSIAKVMNFFGDNNELLIIFGMGLLTLSAGLCIMLNREVTPLPKLLGWFSLLVGVVTFAGPLGFFSFLFGFPIWLIATGFVIATKARRGTLGTTPGNAPANVSAPVSAPQPVTT